MTIANVVTPIGAALVGGLITYLLNVRVRRRTYVEDLFNQAIAATAAAAASVDYLSDTGRPDHLSDAEYADLRKWFVTEGLKSWAVRQDAANVAIAGVVPYDPTLARFLPVRIDASNPTLGAEIVAALRKNLPR